MDSLGIAGHPEGFIKMLTLQAVAAAAAEVVHEHSRNCRCPVCHRQALSCLDCRECRLQIEDKITDVLRKVNKPRDSH